MHEYLPILIVGAIIGVFTLIFLVAYALEKNKKETMGFERHMEDSEIVRRLLTYARPYWKEFALTLFVMLLSIGYDLLSPLLIGNIQALVKGDFRLQELYLRVAVYAGILVVSLVCTYLQAMILQKTGQKILSRIRLDVFTRLKKPAGFPDALLDPLGQLVQMDMAGVIFVPGIDHADEGTLLLLRRIAHAAHQSAAALARLTESPFAFQSHQVAILMENSLTLSNRHKIDRHPHPGPVLQ